MPNQHPNSAQSRAVGGTFFLRERFLWCNLLFCGRLIRWLDFRVFASAYFLFCKQERLARPFVKFFTIYFHLSSPTFWGIPHSTFTACVYAKYAHFIVCVSFARPASHPMAIVARSPALCLRLRDLTPCSRIVRGFADTPR